MLNVKQGLALLVQPAMKSTLVRAAMLIPLAPSLRSPQIAAHTKALALELSCSAGQNCLNSPSPSRNSFTQEAK